MLAKKKHTKTANIKWHWIPIQEAYIYCLIHSIQINAYQLRVAKTIKYVMSFAFCSPCSSLISCVSAQQLNKNCAACIRVCDFYYTLYPLRFVNVLNVCFLVWHFYRFLADQRKFFYEIRVTCVRFCLRKLTLTSEKLRMKDEKHTHPFDGKTWFSLATFRIFCSDFGTSFVLSNFFCYCEKFLDS